MSLKYNEPDQERVFFESRLIVVGEAIATSQQENPDWESSPMIYDKQMILTTSREDHPDGAAYFGIIVCDDQFVITTRVGCDRYGEPVHIRPVDDRRIARLATQRAQAVLLEFFQKREQELVAQLKAENKRLHASNVWLLKKALAAMTAESEGG